MKQETHKMVMHRLQRTPPEIPAEPLHYTELPGKARKAFSQLVLIYSLSSLTSHGIIGMLGELFHFLQLRG